MLKCVHKIDHTLSQAFVENSWYQEVKTLKTILTLNVHLQKCLSKVNVLLLALVNAVSDLSAALSRTKFSAPPNILWSNLCIRRAMLICKLNVDLNLEQYAKLSRDHHFICKSQSFHELQYTDLILPCPFQKMGVLFKLRVVDGPPGKCYLPHDVDHPLFTSTVDRALSSCVPGGGPVHFKLLVEWDQQTKQW